MKEGEENASEYIWSKNILYKRYNVYNTGTVA